MKKMLIPFLLLFLLSCSRESVQPASSSSTVSSSTDRSVSADAVPAGVKNSFIQLFGNISVREWKYRSDGTWRAHFLKNGVAWQATFDGNGALLKSEAAG